LVGPIGRLTRRGWGRLRRGMLGAIQACQDDCD